MQEPRQNENAGQTSESTPPTCHDLTHDLAASVTGLPEDLATNPKYMEGFGK